MESVTFKEMVLRLLNDQLSCQGGTNAVYYLKDCSDDFHKVCELDLYDGRTKCEDGYFDYNEYIIDDEGINDRLFIKTIMI